MKKKCFAKHIKLVPWSLSVALDLSAPVGQRPPLRAVDRLSIVDLPFGAGGGKATPSPLLPPQFMTTVSTHRLESWLEGLGLILI